MNIRELLNAKVLNAMKLAGVPDNLPALVAAGKKAGLGDYQANCAMGAAKALGKNPRELATHIAENLREELSGVAQKIEVAGPGFINIDLNPQWLGEQIATAQTSPRLNVAQVEQADTVVIDYSGPNLAKEMHVGHLRSTIIGDVLARLLSFQGHTVIRQNHVGDWGTQFGMLIAQLEEELHAATNNQEMALKDLEVFYQKAKKHFDEDEAFANKAREYVVRLQSGDAEIFSLWQQFKKISLEHSKEIYSELNVTLTDEDVRGESFYNDDLAPLVQELKNQGLAQESDGAQVVFLQELADKDGNPSPVIIQKQGGGFLYATTDLAALRYRATQLHANRIMYFIDARQSLHMQQVFTLARKAQFINPSIRLEHLAFGTMMGSDGKPFKTRSGGTVKLAELLTEAVERAELIVREKSSDLSDQEIKNIARKVGIGSVKYADLCKTRTNDYVFSWESMLSFEGNTAPYLQYAYTRVQSIFRKADLAPKTITAKILISSEQEKSLAIKLLQFSEVLDQVSREAMPHILCSYLYDIAGLFMTFYEACPILKEGIEEPIRDSRLRLSHLVEQTMEKGLDLLGIEVMERM